MRVMRALDPSATQERVLYVALSAGIGAAGGRAKLDAVLERALISVTSGRGDADELRAAFALGGWAAVDALLTGAQGSSHVRTDSP